MVLTTAEAVPSPFPARADRQPAVEAPRGQALSRLAGAPVGVAGAAVPGVVIGSGVSLAMSTAGVYGLSDFLGGLAATRRRAATVSLVVLLRGLTVAVPRVILAGGRMASADVALAAGMAVAGTVASVAYYRCLGIGPMGVCAPVTSVVPALVPAVAGFASGSGSAFSVWWASVWRFSRSASPRSIRQRAVAW